VDVPIGRQLALTNKALQHWIDQRLAPEGSSLTTWIVLWNAAAAEPPGLSQRELAANMAIGGPALVKHLDRLEDEGHVRRTRDPHDRRITRVTITRQGRDHLERLKVVMDDADASIRAQLSDAELRSMRRALGKLHSYVTADAHNALTGSERTDVA
jgi:DNA-binding MarR family transcriptional regulator